jgi:hypothetical protein
VLTAEIDERAVRGLRAGASGTNQLLQQVREGKLNPYSATRRIIEDKMALAALMAEPNDPPQS